MKVFDVHVKEEFPFLGKDGADAVLTCYLPFNMTEMHRENQKRPCMLICPGGGYQMVSQREGEPIAMHFFAMGYNVFVLTYSVFPFRFPQQICEVAAAMELIYKNAEQWNADTSKIAIMGFSAGAHLAAHYANAYHCPEVRALFPESKPVAATVLGYPVISGVPGISHAGSFDALTGHEGITEEEIDRFSCDRLVGEHTPPAFIWHTASDAAVPVQNSFLYAEALSRLKIPFELHIYPFGPHGLSTADAQSCDNLTAESAHASDWLDAVKKWLPLILK